MSDIACLAELVQEFRDRLLLRINFAGQPSGDDAVLVLALFIIQAWSKIDPQVEGLSPSR